MLADVADASTVFPEIVGYTFPIIVVSDGAQRSINVGISMGYLVDPEKSLDIDQIRKPTMRWQPIVGTNPSFGFVDDAHWFQFQIDNRTGTDLKRLIELPQPFLDDVKLFHEVQDRIVDYHTLGDQDVFSQRKVRHQNLAMPVQLNHGLNQIYSGVASSGVM